MKITISKSSLFNKLKPAGKIIQPSKTNPELENFLFEIKDGKLYVTGADESGRITTCVDCLLEDVTETVFTANAKLLSDALRELPERPLELNISFEPERVKIKCEHANGKFEIAGGKGETFPGGIDSSADCIESAIASLDLLHGLKRTYFRASGDELRPVINGVLVDRNENGLAFAATDGNTLALMEYPYDDSESFSFILPLKIAKLLVDTIPPDDNNMKLVISANNVIFEHNDFTINSRRLEGKYPRYRAVIPQNNDKFLRADKSQLISALKRVTVFCDKTSFLVQMKLSEGRLVLSGQDIAFATSANEEIKADYEGKEFEIGFKSEWLLELLSAVPSSEITMSFSDHTRAALIKETNARTKEVLTYLIMPLQIITK